jgi:UDP-2,3-diacylglucosamine hydrolase
LRNQAGLDADLERQMRVFREYAAKLQGYADIVVFGHVHRPFDLAHANPRLIVLGGWQRRTSYLKIDARGATFHVEHDRENYPPAPALPSQPSLTHRGDFDEV